MDIVKLFAIMSPEELEELSQQLNSVRKGREWHVGDRCVWRDTAGTVRQGVVAVRMITGRLGVRKDGDTEWKDVVDPTTAVRSIHDVDRNEAATAAQVVEDCKKLGLLDDKGRVRVDDFDFSFEDSNLTPLEWQGSDDNFNAYFPVTNEHARVWKNDEDQWGYAVRTDRGKTVAYGIAKSEEIAKLAVRYVQCGSKFGMCRQNMAALAERHAAILSRAPGR